jgi:catecholate siderophore receptor
VHSVQNPSNVPWTGSISTDGADRYNIRSKNQSVYFLDNIELSPQWLLDLGVRWDKFETKQTMTYGARNNATGLIIQKSQLKLVIKLRLKTTKISLTTKLV